MSLGVFLLGLLAASLIPGVPKTLVSAGYFVWASSLLVVGMPHGAYDIAAIRRDTLAAGGGGRSVLIHSGVYGLVTLLAALVFVAAPTVSIILFLFLAAHHFGMSDSVWTRGRASRARGDHAIGLCHGLIVIATPFVFDAPGAWSPFGRFAAIAGGRWEPNPAMLALTAGGLIALAWVVLARATVQSWRRRETGRAVLGEQLSVMVLVTAISAVAPPLLAIAAYFVIVHATGHCLRAKSPGAADPSLRASCGNLVRVHVASLPLLAPSLAIVWAMTLLFPAAGPIEGFALAFILFCVAGTPPHHALWLRLIGPARHRAGAPIRLGVRAIAPSTAAG